MHRAGELAPVRVPSPAEEAVRDLVRARADLLDDRKRMQQRLNAVLLRHGRIWPGAKWTYAHRVWVDKQEFGEPALAEALAVYRARLEAREAELRAAEARLADWAGRDPLAGPVARLGGYRGIAQLTGLTVLRTAGLRFRHANMSLAVAKATTPPRYTAPNPPRSPPAAGRPRRAGR